MKVNAMKKEYSFSNGQRGKFYRPGVKLNLPIYIDQDLKKYFPNSESVNEALRCLLPLVAKKNDQETSDHP